MEAGGLGIGTFQREFLAELHIAEVQLVALGEAVPAERYGWRPAEDARPFSAVLVHIAAGNFCLLDRAGVSAPGMRELYSEIEGDPAARFVAVLQKNLELERTMTEKTAVMDLLKRSLKAVGQSFEAMTGEALAASGNFFGEPTTVRRVYLRMLAHMHEHMGQAIAYARMIGVKVPWPDPLKELERIAAKASSR